jgi:sec-independent protein translocase protein TatB
MFGMSLGEILIIAVIAILFIGPDKLPQAMVKVAKFFKSFKQTVHETKETIEQEMHLAEMKEEALSYKETLDNAVNDFKLDSDVNIMDDLKESAKELENSIKETPSVEQKTIEKPKSEKKKEKKSKKKKKKSGDADV